MTWTRQKRYLPYNKWNAETLLKLQSQAANSKWQMHYHLHAPSGLINDPNGFSYFNGEYHVFAQNYPFGAVHGLKSWIHFKSSDLVHWQSLGTCNLPDTEADSHGAYSGSALPIDNELFIMYTGNHREKDWSRIPYQVGAYLDQNGQVTDKQVLFKNPAHITEHFRDPQIIKKDGSYYAILGAQDLAKHGHIDVWKSKDLKNWQEIGFLNFTDQDLGYMIECPNLVKVGDKYVLVFCPQGLTKEVADYDNIYPNMYVVCDDVDFENARLINPSKIQNFDCGFDLYATQVFNTPDNKAYAISWVGLPDITYPSDQENWAGCLSQVKELTIADGKLYQKPVEAIKTLRQNEQVFSNQKLITSNSHKQYEFEVTIAADQVTELSLAANSDHSQALLLKIDTKKGRLVLDRTKAGKVASEYGTSRDVVLNQKALLKLNIFVDHSVVEIFVNDGQQVITGRFFVNETANRIEFRNETSYQAKLWQIADC